MSVIQCDGCGDDVWANDEDTVGYCPDCSGEYASHGKHYQREQAESLRADENRQRVIDNEVNK